MRLPAVQYADGIRQGKQDQFKGLNHNLGAKDGELWDMRNLTSDYYPLQATRAPRLLYKTLTAPGGPVLLGEAVLGGRHGILLRRRAEGHRDGRREDLRGPGRLCGDISGQGLLQHPHREFGSLESTWSGPSLTFTNGSSTTRTRTPTVSRPAASAGRITSRPATP